MEDEWKPNKIIHYTIIFIGVAIVFLGAIGVNISEGSVLSYLALYCILYFVIIGVLVILYAIFVILPLSMWASSPNPPSEGGRRFFDTTTSISNFFFKYSSLFIAAITLLVFPFVANRFNRGHRYQTTTTWSAPSGYSNSHSTTEEPAVNQELPTLAEPVDYPSADYKYNHRTGTSGDYTYNYDVYGNNVNGNCDMHGKYGECAIIDDDGNTQHVEAEWVRKGVVEVTDEAGNRFEMEVE